VGALTSGATRASAMREDGRAEGLLGVNPVPVASVEVVAPARGVRVKQRRQMEAVIRGADGSRLKGRKVLWDTSDPKVAEVDASTGGLRALSEGSVRVTARCEEVEGHRALTIQPSGVAPVVWVAGVGGVAILAAILLVWRFSLPVEEGVPGLDWAGPPGDVVEEMAAPVATVELTADRESVTVNNQVRLEALALDEEGTALEDRRVEWRTSDPAVASVTALGSVATVLARRAGTALITATVGDVTGSLEVLVQEVAPAPSPAESSPVVTAIRIEPAQGVLDVGETRQLRAADQGGSPVVVTYRTSDPAVVAISSQGALRARRPGTVTVTASYAELTAEAQFQVREVVVEEAAPIPTLSEATADSIRSSLKAVEEHGSMAEYDTAYEILGRVGLRLAELKIQFPVAPSLLEDLEKDYREQFQRTYENCEFYRQAMMGREQSPPSCRPPPTGGGNDAR
jgi:hypothetical protein